MKKKQMINFAIASAIMLIGIFILFDTEPNYNPDFIQRHNNIYGLSIIAISLAWFRFVVYKKVPKKP